MKTKPSLAEGAGAPWFNLNKKRPTPNKPVIFLHNRHVYEGSLQREPAMAGESAYDYIQALDDATEIEWGPDPIYWMEIPELPKEDNEHSSNCILVDAGIIKLILNILHKDAAEGKVIRGEIADELEKSCHLIEELLLKSK